MLDNENSKMYQKKWKKVKNLHKLTVRVKYMYTG